MSNNQSNTEQWALYVNCQHVMHVAMPHELPQDWVEKAVQQIYPGEITTAARCYDANCPFRLKEPASV